MRLTRIPPGIIFHRVNEQDLQRLASIARRTHELSQRYVALSAHERFAKREQYVALFDALARQYEKARARMNENRP
jgi:hypothetical protein